MFSVVSEYCFICSLVEKRVEFYVIAFVIQKHRRQSVERSISLVQIPVNKQPVTEFSSDSPLPEGAANDLRLE